MSDKHQGKKKEKDRLRSVAPSSGVESGGDNGAAAGDGDRRRGSDSADERQSGAGTPPDRMDIVLEALARLSSRLESIERKASTPTKGSARRQDSDSDSDGGDDDDDNDDDDDGESATGSRATDESTSREAKQAAFEAVMGFSEKAERFRPPKGVDTTRRKQQVFSVPSHLRPEDAAPFRSEWIRHAYDSLYSLGHHLEVRGTALYHFMSSGDFDSDTASVFLAELLAASLDMVANTRFIMDRATSERPELAAEGRIAMAHVMPEEAVDSSPLARLTAKMRKEAARKAMRTIQRKALERQVEQLIRTPASSAGAQPARAQHQQHTAPATAYTGGAGSAATTAARTGKKSFPKKQPQGGAGQGAEKAQASSDA